MKPFDLKTWQENPGIKVVTRAGSTVHDLTFCPNRTEFQMIGIIADTRSPSTWRTNGFILISGYPYDTDLVFADDPQPKLRPWKPEEVPVGCWVRHVSNPERRLVTVVNSICVETVSGVIRYPELLEDYEHTTDGVVWKPCGVLE
jgi:hypothetical protein